MTFQRKPRRKRRLKINKRKGGCENILLFYYGPFVYYKIYIEYKGNNINY